MSAVWKAHMDRLRAGTLGRYKRGDIARWLEENTFLKGEPFSFAGHEYQLKIIEETSKNIVVTKPSQVGCSELVARLILARAAIEPLNIIYVMPTQSAASDFAKGRVNDIINDSPYLSGLIDSSVDNVSVKKLGHSFVFFKGASKDSQAISVPSDIVVADEFSYANATVVKQYQSRLNHSKYKEKIYFSTPTLPGRGISALFDESKQHFRMVKCTHCGHWSWPNLPHDIRIPGVPEIDWSTLNKVKLARLDYMSAFFACPKCGKEPDYTPEHREWVCKNPDDKYEAVGYAVSPCDLPDYRKASDLVMERTEYARYVDFMNTGCGLPYEDLESTYTYEELAACFISEKGGSNMMRVMGLDMGLECACTIWAVNYDGLMILEHAEMIPIGRLDERRGELTRQYRVSLTVADALPYTDTIMRMQVYDPNLWAAVFVRTKNAETHTLKRYEEKPSEGRDLVRQVNINRDPSLDAMMGHLRSGMMKFAVPEMKEELIAHFMDMTRERQYTNDNEMRYVWVKSSKGVDHLLFSGLYAFIGAKMRGASTGLATLPTTSVFTFKNKNGL